MKKGGFLRNVLDTIRPNQQQQVGGAGSGGLGSPLECGGQLRPEHFALGLVAMHGFPMQQSAFAYDPVQRLAATGTSSGALRVFGRPGIEAWAQHKPELAITHLRFIINQGALITVTADSGLHLWSLRGSQLKLQFSSPGSGGPAPSPIPAAASGQLSKQQNSAEADYLTHDHRSLSLSSDNNNNNDNNNLGQNYNCDSSNKQLQILHTLKFKREHITCLHQTLMSKWLYVGTERGNVHVVNVETFQLSGYSIAWNKAIVLTRKTHPGAIIHLSECPQDTNKLLIGYQSGCIALWDLKSRTAACRFYHSEGLLSLSWLHDGKQFVAAHSNGTLVTWLVRNDARPAQVLYPHVKGPNALDCDQQQPSLSDQPVADEIYLPITKVEWRSSRNNEPLLVFSGGGLASGDIEAPNENRPQQQASMRPTSLTIMLGKSIAVLELVKPIVDFIVICEGSPHDNEPSEPSAVYVLLENELTIVDLQTPGYPTLKQPYSASRLAESPVTYIQYLADCSPELISLLYTADSMNEFKDPDGSNHRVSSGRDWPIVGGDQANSQMQSYPEIVITGHADGSVKFWDMSGLNLEQLANVRSANLFDGPIWPSPENYASQDETSLPMEFPFAISRLEFCATRDSPHRLLVAGALGQVVQFKLLDRKKEQQIPSQSGCEPAILVVDQPATNSTDGQQQSEQRLPIGANQPQQMKPKPRRHMVLKVRRTPAQASSSSGGSSMPASCSSAKSQQHTTLTSALAGSGQQQQLHQRPPRPSGFQPELICLSPLEPKLEANGGGQQQNCYQPPPKVTALVYEATHSILAYAHEAGLVLVDIIQKNVIISASLADLYGGASLMGHGDISIQPFATSSILQQHYQDQQEASGSSGGAASLPISSSSPPPTASSGNSQPGFRAAGWQQQHNNSPASQADNISATNNGAQATTAGNGPDNGPFRAAGGGGGKSTRSGGPLANNGTCNGSSNGPDQSQLASAAPARGRPRSAIGGAFQRQLSTTALRSEQASSAAAASQPGARDGGPIHGFRQFQRQMTASQLSSHESPTGARPRALLTASPVRAGQPLAGLEPALACSMSSLGSGPMAGSQLINSSQAARLARRQPETDDQQQRKATATKGKRIISRMLSISTIHSSLGSNDSGQQDRSTDTSCGSTANNISGGVSKNSASLDQASDKLDSSLARSRSSSCSSETSPKVQQQQPQLSRGESIECLCFLDWGSRPAIGGGSSPAVWLPPGNNNKSLGSIDGPSQTPHQLALWLGTSQGSVLLLSLSMPDNDDNRILQLESVDAEPIPQATIKLQGPIKCLSNFTSELVRPHSSAAAASGQPPSPPLAQSASGSLEAFDSPTSSLDTRSKSPGSHAQPPTRPKSAQPPLPVPQQQPTSGPESVRPPNFLVIVSERQARVYQMPGDSQALAAVCSAFGAKLLTAKSNCLAKVDFSSSVNRAHLMQMRQPNESCLATQVLIGGQLQVHSLPQLKVLIETQLDPPPATGAASGVVFSRNGHALYQPSPNEIAKLTLSAQYKALAANMSGNLYVPREMPELPRASNFFKSLLGSVGSSLISKQCDRDELFGAKSQATPRTKLPGSAGLDRIRAATTGGLASEMRLAREGLDERGEKLSEIEDRTLAMMNQSETYSHTSHQLAQKFKDKKWYQF